MIDLTDQRRDAAERLRDGILELAEYRDPDRQGWTREVFSAVYRESRNWVARRMAAAGLQVHEDTAGNIVGRLSGTDPNAPALVTGSHTDSVDGGGRFDGVVGVLGALEAVQLLRESGQRLRRDLLVVDFLGEESNAFGLSCLGSRAIAGELTRADLDRQDYRGVSLGRAYRDFGLDPGAVLETRWARAAPLHAFIELHIEQGPTLEQRQLPLGIVTAITGIERLVATFMGSPDHAGTRPMYARKDAMVAAAEAVLSVRREGCGAPNHGVATTTRIESESRSPNVVPSLVRMTSEVRSVDSTWLSGVRGRLAEEILVNARNLGVDVEFDWSTDNTVVHAHSGIHDVAAAAADAIGIPWMPIPSGATHDAVHMAALAPMGMIFVPSKAGKSHCPEEWSDFADIATGVGALAQTLTRLDRTELTPQHQPGPN
ncbi:M20 family metallo-hydrolase [Arthrobacter oryzae]|uniref:Zn-dependent hydrolase n=1 Tax=Arthrobacter oryzae TaxID=409290 RepID=A0A3N0BJ37_9MICC|nr:M20 family metallo-hydrolase [Arthrobacter oryzae]RNL48240.1 Zn-dependent hydrolase [Arthrobacter oryzae]